MTAGDTAGFALTLVTYLTILTEYNTSLLFSINKSTELYMLLTAMHFILLVAQKIKAMKCEQLAEMLLQKLDDDAYKPDVEKLIGMYSSYKIDLYAN